MNLTKEAIHKARKFVLDKLNDSEYFESYSEEKDIFEIILVALGEYKIK